jgi:hypothetical protein
LSKDAQKAEQANIPDEDNVAWGSALPMQDRDAVEMYHYVKNQTRCSSYVKKVNCQAQKNHCHHSHICEKQSRQPCAVVPVVALAVPR